MGLIWGWGWGGVVGAAKQRRGALSRAEGLLGHCQPQQAVSWVRVGVRVGLRLGTRLGLQLG